MELTSSSRRSLWWYVKFIFACQAAAFALWLLIAIVAMPFVGNKLFDMYFDGRAYLFLPLYLVCAPVVWKYLR
jgi:hypothetical protein